MIKSVRWWRIVIKAVQNNSEAHKSLKIEFKSLNSPRNSFNMSVLWGKYKECRRSFCFTSVLGTPTFALKEIFKIIHHSVCLSEFCLSHDVTRALRYSELSLGLLIGSIAKSRQRSPSVIQWLHSRGKRGFREDLEDGEWGVLAQDKILESTMYRGQVCWTYHSSLYIIRAQLLFRIHWQKSWKI